MQNKDEPSTAPIPDRWYTLALGSSFKDHQPSSKFCTLRYEFKPASIDKSQPGLLHKTKDNKISVEFHNNQPGKPKVTFEGTSEDYKENDAVLFFDGHTFRLERLHRAVKRLRHVRLPGESAAAASASMGGASAADAGSPPLGRGVKGPAQNLNARPAFTQPLPPPPPPPPLPVEVERINVERIDIGDAGGKPRNEEPASTPPADQTTTASPDSNDFDLEAQLDIMNDDDEENTFEPDKNNFAGEKLFHTGIDINLPHNDTDDEIADVDINDDNGGIGHNAAEALRAQVNAEEREEQSSSESESSESESSESSSGESSSSSGDSESSDGDSVNSI